jgi:hypothetical protein
MAVYSSPVRRPLVHRNCSALGLHVPPFQLPNSSQNINAGPLLGNFLGYYYWLIVTGRIGAFKLEAASIHSFRRCAYPCRQRLPRVTAPSQNIEGQRHIVTLCHGRSHREGRSCLACVLTDRSLNNRTARLRRHRVSPGPSSAAMPDLAARVEHSDDCVIRSMQRYDLDCVCKKLRAIAFSHSGCDGADVEYLGRLGATPLRYTCYPSLLHYSLNSKRWRLTGWLYRTRWPQAGNMGPWWNPSGCHRF